MCYENNEGGRNTQIGRDTIKHHPLIFAYSSLFSLTQWSQVHSKNPPQKQKKTSLDMCCADPNPACKKGNLSLFPFNKTEQVMFSTLLMPKPFPTGPVGEGKVGQITPSTVNK